MKTNIVLTPAKLREAADLQEAIETSQNRLTALLTGQPVTLKSPRASLKSRSRNGKAKHRGRAKGSRFTPAQKAKISAGLRRKWAERKALQAAQARVAPVVIAAPAPAQVAVPA
jgi:hypothetical protein